VRERIIKRWRSGEQVPRDAFGDYKLDAVNVGQLVQASNFQLLGGKDARAQIGYSRARGSQLGRPAAHPSMVDHRSSAACAPCRASSGTTKIAAAACAPSSSGIKGGKPFDGTCPGSTTAEEIRQPRGKICPCGTTNSRRFRRPS